MNEQFRYDVFISHSSHDKPAARELAERLRRDGLKVWFDEWEIKPGDAILLKIQAGLEQSRTLVLVMSQHASASEWVTFEHHSVLFRDPTNQQRRFIPVRLDDTEIRDALKQFAYVDWRQRSEEQYKQLLAACGPAAPEIERVTEQEGQAQQPGDPPLTKESGGTPSTTINDSSSLVVLEDPQPETESLRSPSAFDPLNTLRLALNVLKIAGRKVPQLRYAYYIIGVAAMISIVLLLISNIKVAVFGVLIGLALMFLVAILVDMTGDFPTKKYLAAFLAWTVSLMFVTVLSLLISSFTFGKPPELAEALYGREPLKIPPIASEEIFRYSIQNCSQKRGLECGNYYSGKDGITGKSYRFRFKLTRSKYVYLISLPELNTFESVLTARAGKALGISSNFFNDDYFHLPQNLPFDFNKWPYVGYTVILADTQDGLAFLDHENNRKAELEKFRNKYFVETEAKHNSEMTVLSVPSWKAKSKYLMFDLKIDQRR